MKNLIKFLLFVILFTVTISAQQMYFCEGVTSDGYPRNSSDLFTIPRDGGYLYALVKLSYAIECDEVTYYIYKLNSYGDRSYYTSYYVEVNKGWSWFWKQITFYEPGLYEVEVVDCYDYSVASGRLRIKY